MSHLSQVEIFLEVVKHNSFIGAARSLGMTGPAVSKQVQALENKLGVRLLNRTTRLINLTEEGVIYSKKAEKAINDLREAEQEILESRLCPSGPLKISVPVTYGLQYLTKPINEFSKAYPNVSLEVLFDDRRVDLVAENFDVAIRIGVLPDSSLIARKLHHCPIILCASPKLLQKYGKPSYPQELAHFPAIIYNKHNNEGLWHFMAPNKEKGSIRLNKNLVTNTAEMMVQACLNEIGIAAIPIFSCVNFLKSGELVQVLENYKTYPQPNIYILYKHREHISTRLQLFVDNMVETAKSLPW